MRLLKPILLFLAVSWMALLFGCLPIEKGPLLFSSRFSEALVNQDSISVEQELRLKVESMIKSKCISCHGNGMRLGGFGGFEDLDSLVKEGLLFNLENPGESLFYRESESGDMPLDPRQRLSDEELSDLLEWISLMKDQ